MSKSFYETLIQDTPLAIIVIGLFLFIVGAAGGWPTPKLEVKEHGWRVALAVMGIIAALSGGLLFWYEKVRNTQFQSTERQSNRSETIAKSTTVKRGDNKAEIEGKYNAEDDLNYVNTISHVSENVFKINNPVWEGIGLFDGEIYYGIYRYNEKAHPDMRGKWGTHKAELCFERKRWILKVTETNMGDNSIYEWKWFKATDD